MAWLDLLGPVPARGIVTRAALSQARPRTARRRGQTTVDARLTVPRSWPGGLLRAGLVRAYNA